MSEFKSWATRCLRNAGVAGADQKVWTYHGSTRYINDFVNLEKTVHYVKECQ